MKITLSKSLNKIKLASLINFNSRSLPQQSTFRQFTTVLNNDVQDDDIYFPKVITDLNKFKRDIVQVEEIDHPCFKDPFYVKRKNVIQEISNAYNIGDPIPIIDYLDVENQAWKYVVGKINPKIPTNCCKEINDNFREFKDRINLTIEKIPQIRDISDVLKSKTGFTMCPVGGLLNARHFLNSLAFKVFASTQFIRPLEKAEYSGEPDILHEIIGHTAMLADENFAEFSQDIGIASLGASDEDIKILGNIYWFTIEYGLVKETVINSQGKEERQLRIYGGGITPSVFEIDYALSGKAKYWPLDFDKMQTAYYDYVNLSTNYFVAESFESMKLQFREYSKVIKSKKPWIHFDKKTNIASVKRI